MSVSPYTFIVCMAVSVVDLLMSIYFRHILTISIEPYWLIVKLIRFDLDRLST